ncbi:MAG: glycerophosphodiester phosphodiesterase family protein [Geminicoccaceae bacterium]
MSRVWQTRIASHRGGALEWPENSPTAFINTAKLPVDQVEFDIHPSSDGVLVVIHDPTLDRTTDGEGPVIAKSWAEIRRLRLTGTDGEAPLRLEELFEIFRATEIALRLEIKPGVDFHLYQGIELAVLKLLRDQAMHERTMITSFFLEPLARVRAIDPPEEMAWLVNPLVLRSVGGVTTCASLAKRLGIDHLGLRQETVNSAVLDQALCSGVRLGAWATHEDDAIRRMLELGVSLFTTDRPTAALQIRDQLGFA